MPTVDTIPVTLLTGFLGSGKTTVLNHIIRSAPRTAVLMNEFGEVGLDHQLLERMEGPLALLAGGCVCCTLSGSLAPSLKNLYMARQKGDIPAFKRVVIETTGIADPAPILDVLLHDPWLFARFRLDGVVTTVDAVLGEQQLDSYFEAVRQVAVADRLLLTKIDLADGGQCRLLQERLARLNPAAHIIGACRGAIDTAEIFGLGLYDPSSKSPDVLRWLRESRYAPVRRDALGRVAPAKGSWENHDVRVQSFSIVLDEPISRVGLESALAMLVSFRSGHLLRFKAIVNVAGEAAPSVLHGVQHVLYPEEKLPGWPDEDTRSRFVFIVRDLEPQFVAKVLDDFAGASLGMMPASVVEMGNRL